MVDLNKIKSIKVTSDGTAENTIISTDRGDIISTVVALSYNINAESPAAKLKLEVMLPALELDIPVEDIELEIASVRECPECGKELSPTVTSRVVPGDEEKDEKATHEAIVVYTCDDCEVSRTYPFTFDWESVPQDLEEYQDAKEEKTEE